MALSNSSLTAGIFQCNSIQSAILRDLIGQIFATELDFIGKCLQSVTVELTRAPAFDIVERAASGYNRSNEMTMPFARTFREFRIN